MRSLMKVERGVRVSARSDNLSISPPAMGDPKGNIRRAHLQHRPAIGGTLGALRVPPARDLRLSFQCPWILDHRRGSEVAVRAARAEHCRRTGGLAHLALPRCCAHGHPGRSTGVGRHQQQPGGHGKPKVAQAVRPSHGGASRTASWSFRAVASAGASAGTRRGQRTSKAAAP